MIRTMVLIFFSIVLFSSALANENDEFNKREDIQNCKTIYCIDGIRYNNYLDILKLRKDNESLLVDLKLSALAGSDLHILLSNNLNATEFDEGYEIVLGGWKNSKSVIRRKLNGDAKASVITNNILSDLDFRSFWLTMTKEGTIKVGKRGEENPFLSWHDPNPLHIEYLSFGTWGPYRSKIIFDCDYFENLCPLENNVPT